MITQRLAAWIVIAAAFVVLVAAETLRPLRRSVEPKPRRVVRNLTTGAVSLALMTLLQAPLLLPVVRWTESHRIGLLQLVVWPRWIELAVALLLLDYTLWWWHRANHLVPLLWRFHLVHHIDRDLDASTAFRFHFGELTLSLGWRAVQIAVIGASAEAVWVWQSVLFVSTLFHHSNLRLPQTFERALVRLVVTPRMHGIHHSDRQDEANSNWSSILTCWDALHRTLRLDVPQESLTIGVPAYSAPSDVTIGKVLLVPFVRQRNDWRATRSSASGESS
ncbi:MAG TPA: sterol desaturase family protein [Thermoanaerobaculia bacterium]|jgi:sterol desaturase/sphingolipid hydroxylase (fatty acid hydroxylase superfamily)